MATTLRGRVRLRADGREPAVPAPEPASATTSAAHRLSTTMTDAPPVNTGRIQGGRFRKGTSGNPAGKPRGARHKTTLAVEGLMGQYAHQVTARMVKRAVDGDVGAARLILDRIAPVRRGRAVHLKIGGPIQQ